jgi:hypothetical protein
MELERMHLGIVDSIDIIDYVKKSVEILMSMREDEFLNYKQNWEMQEQLRLNKERNNKLDTPKNKKYKTPKNSRFFAKIKKETESMITPKTNKKRELKLNAKQSPENLLEDIPTEYEALLQKLENDVRKHIRTEQ